MSLDRPGETEAELVDRRGREAAARARAHDARIEAHRRAGTLEQRPVLFLDLEYMPRRGNWGS